MVRRARATRDNVKKAAVHLLNKDLWIWGGKATQAMVKTFWSCGPIGSTSGIQAEDERNTTDRLQVRTPTVPWSQANRRPLPPLTPWMRNATVNAKDILGMQNSRE